MDFLHWTKSETGWSCDRYRIERATPHLLAMIDLTTRHESLIQFSPSAAWLKHVARRRERSRHNREMVLRHAGRMGLALLAVQASISFAPILVFPSALIAAGLALRALVWWMDSIQGSPWSRIRETYQ